jgi:hypothetical protein
MKGWLRIYAFWLMIVIYIVTNINFNFLHYIYRNLYLLQFITIVIYSKNIFLFEIIKRLIIIYTCLIQTILL